MHAHRRTNHLCKRRYWHGPSSLINHGQTDEQIDHCCVAKWECRLHTETFQQPLVAYLVDFSSLIYFKASHNSLSCARSSYDFCPYLPLCFSKLVLPFFFLSMCIEALLNSVEDKCSTKLVVRASNMCHFPKLERNAEGGSLCNSVETNVPGVSTLTLKDLCETVRRRHGGPHEIRLC